MSDTRTIGIVYGIPPQPHVDEHTEIFPAGAVSFGVEYRDLDPESLRATYGHDPAQLAELEERAPGGLFWDQGVTIHVWDAADGHLYVRFDCFDDEPHYHYNHRIGGDGTVVNNVVPYDSVAHGPMLPWAIETLRTRLPEMLEHAGAADVAARLDREVVDRAIDDVAARASEISPASRRRP
jgi:hypothetical protein